MDNVTNKRYKGNLVQVIETDIRGLIYSEEGVFLTLNNTQKKSQENCSVELLLEVTYKSIKWLNQVQIINPKNILFKLSEMLSDNQLQTTLVNRKWSTIDTTNFNKSFTMN